MAGSLVLLVKSLYLMCVSIYLIILHSECLFWFDLYVVKFESIMVVINEDSSK